MNNDLSYVSLDWLNFVEYIFPKNYGMRYYKRELNQLEFTADLKPCQI